MERVDGLYIDVKVSGVEEAKAGLRSLRDEIGQYGSSAFTAAEIQQHWDDMLKRTAPDLYELQKGLGPEGLAGGAEQAASSLRMSSASMIAVGTAATALVGFLVSCVKEFANTKGAGEELARSLAETTGSWKALKAEIGGTVSSLLALPEAARNAAGALAIARSLIPNTDSTSTSGQTLRSSLGPFAGAFLFGDLNRLFGMLSPGMPADPLTGSVGSGAPGREGWGTTGVGWATSPYGVLDVLFGADAAAAAAAKEKLAFGLLNTWQMGPVSPMKVPRLNDLQLGRGRLRYAAGISPDQRFDAAWSDFMLEMSEPGTTWGSNRMPARGLGSRMEMGEEIDALTERFESGRIGLEEYRSELESIRDTLQSTFGEDSDPVRGIDLLIAKTEDLTVKQRLATIATTLGAQAFGQMGAAAIMAALAGQSWKEAVNQIAQSMAQMMLAMALENTALGIMASTGWGAAVLAGTPAQYFKAAAAFGVAAAAFGAIAGATGGFGNRGTADGGGGGSSKTGRVQGPTTDTPSAPPVFNLTVVVEGNVISENELARIISEYQRRQSGRVGVAR